MSNSNESRLPYRDELGFCNISMVALGGDGANSLGKMLFDTAVQVMDLDGGYDAAYGSEKKGTPTSVSVKLCEVGTPVRQVGPTRTPHILVVFREHLIQAMRLNEGLQENATVIVNTRLTPDEVRERLKLHSGRIICLDATEIATSTKSRINIPLFALLAHTLGFSDDKMKEMIAGQWPKLKDANLAAYEAAATHSVFASYPADGKYPLVPVDYDRKPDIGYENQQIGAVVENVEHLNIRSTKTMRAGLIPIFDAAACIHCVKCYFTCPDPGSVVFSGGQMIGIDYDFCKGCLRCIYVCPETKKGKALTQAIEAEHLDLVAENPAGRKEVKTGDAVNA
ncbi:MAG: 2-oxoacid:acceptor oxidoreductase family protein [Fimbriimonadia bacterium]|jgi:pyruvate ferredoxin oxidoreductase gamma subunit